MSKKLWMPLVAAVIALLTTSFGAVAQTKDGYWTQGGGPVWRNTVNQCWRAAYWTPAMAIPECDGDLTPKGAPIAPPPPTKPAPAPAKPKPVAEKVTLAADVLFDFDKAVLKP